MKPVSLLPCLGLALILLGSFAFGIEAGTMGEENGEMMDQERAGVLIGAAGHHAAGRVVLAPGEGGFVLTLQDMAVDKVPDGRVYLAKNGDHRQGVEIGRLTSFSGTVSYLVPQSVDSAGYDSVVIWCEKFRVEIGRAALTGKGM